MPPSTAIRLPRVAPIVPITRSASFNDRAWLFEPKYDGFRGMVYLTRRSCTIYSKRGNRFNPACRLHLERIVANRKADPYGARTAWYKIKNPIYTQAEGRTELFERRV